MVVQILNWEKNKKNKSCGFIESKNKHIHTDKMKQQMFGQSIFFHNQINSGHTHTHTYYKSVFYGIPTYNEWKIVANIFNMKTEN